MSDLNIVFAASEATPLAKTGGLADVVGSLPHALNHLGHEVTVMLPYYRPYIEAADIAVRPLSASVDIVVDGVDRHIPLHEAVHEGLRYILIEQDDLYARPGIYGPPGGDYDDNPLRYALFTRAVLEASCLVLSRPVDIFHCHDWQAGMLPLLLKTQYQDRLEIADAKCVYTIHNLAYQGVFPPDWIHRLGIPADAFNPGGYEFHGQISFMKVGIMASDWVTTVSSNYAREILTPEFGCGLDDFLHQHAHKLTGIVNGFDVSQWNPATDTAIAENYEPGNLKGKQACKADLQKRLGLTRDASLPMLTMVSRLAGQKGVDLLAASIPDWLAAGYQIVLLGIGDPDFEILLEQLAETHPSQMHFCCGFNEKLGRRIYAGGDIFLMPSRFEPCGLGQLMAMRYGKVARATGGLRDTVLDYDSHRSRATGFTFEAAEVEAFMAAVDRAIQIFQRKQAWRRLRGQCMRRDSSWDASASHYVDLYQSLLI